MNSTDGHKSQYGVLTVFDVIAMLAEIIASVAAHYLFQFLLFSVRSARSILAEFQRCGMDTTQFAMIEELASLVRDNLYSKHLVLSTEEFLVTLLQHQYQDDDDEENDRDTAGTHRGTVGENTIELQPTSSYNHLLLHRLADIYGFAHESVGEGDDRHLILQRCPETAIPPVLVSDVLWKYDDSDEPSASVLIARNETDLQKTYEAEDILDTISVESLHLKTDTDAKPLQQSVPLPLSAVSLKEREAAYRAARERIFSAHDAKGKDTSVVKPRHVPAVAQRMISHALGKRVEDTKERADTVRNREEPLHGHRNIQTGSMNRQYAVRPVRREENYAGKCSSSSPAAGGGPRRNPSTQSRHMPSVSAETLKKEQGAAAKRMFANALRLPGVEITDGTTRKPK